MEPMCLLYPPSVNRCYKKIPMRVIDCKYSQNSFLLPGRWNYSSWGGKLVNASKKVGEEYLFYK
jgi:hypothetical protein